MNFPPLFRSLHSSLFIAFHYLPSPFITFHRRPISLSAHSLLSPVLSSPCPILSPPRPVLSSPRPVLSSPRSRFVFASPCFALSPCPRIPPLHTCFPPASSPPLFHTSVFHAPLSALLCFASLFLLPLFYSLHCFYSLPLFYVLCFTSSPFALLTPLFYTALLCSLHCFTPLCFTLSHCLPPSLYLLPPPSLYLLPLFCTRFFTPRQPPQTRPRHRKRQRFSHFSKKFCKSP